MDFELTEMIRHCLFKSRL